MSDFSKIAKCTKFVRNCGYVIIRAARAVRTTVRPARVLKYINKCIYKILKHALDQKFKYIYYFGPARVLDKIYSFY